MAKVRDWFKKIGSKLKSGPKGRQSKAFIRILQFFAIMLVLTIFAKGAAGVTMPEVALTTLSQQNIRNESNYGGTVTTANKEDVKLLAGLEVTQVHVSPGSTVKEGDPLVSFDVNSLAEKLSAQKIALQELKLALEKLLKDDAQDDTAVDTARKALEAAQEAYNETAASLQKAVDAALTALNSANTAVTTANTNYNNLAAERDAKLADAINVAIANIVAAAQNANATKTANDNAKTIFENLSFQPFDPADPKPATDAPADVAAWTAAKEEMEAAKQTYDTAITTLTNAYIAAGIDLSNPPTDPTDPNSITVDENTFKASINTTYDPLLASANSAITSAQVSAGAAQQAYNDAVARQQKDLATAQKTLDAAAKTLAEAQEDFAEATPEYNLEKQKRQLEITQKRQEIADAQTAIDKLNTMVGLGGTVNATVAGTVSAVTVSKGGITTDTDYVRISTGAEGYIVEFVVPQDKAREMRPGTTVQVKYGNQYWGYEAHISGRGMPEGGNVTVRAQLNTLDFSDGDAVTVNVVLSDKNYWNCVPLAAVRPDTNGHYVLVLYEEATILGSQTVARKVPVTIDDQDQSYAAISGIYENNPRIVLSSTKPVNDGDMVRIDEESSK